jgi:predicted N-acetyltransferase YhbS
MRLVTADDGMVREILDDTYPIWNEGLSREAYQKWYRAQRQTAWGRNRLSRHALVEGGRVVSSAKRYDLDAWVEGRRAAIVGIGAVFTPESARGQGHAGALIDAMIDDARARGCEHALLFSEIGASYYERLGFRVVPQLERTIEVVAKPGAPAVLVRAGEPQDLDAVAELTTRMREGASFALDRPADFVAFSLARKRLLAGLGPSGARSVEFFVTEEAYRAVAYVVISNGPRGRILEDCGDRDPTGARIGAMLQVLAARAPTEAPMRMRGRLRTGFVPPQCRIASESPAEEIMMTRPIGDRAPLAPDPGAVVYANLDVF